MYPYFKKKFIIPAVAAGFLFIGTSFKDDFFEIAKQIEIFTTLFKAVNTNYVDETNPGDLMDKAKKKGFLKKNKEGDTMTRRVDGACIFLNRPGFEGGAGCAFHIAATEANERPLDWKPNVCWQLPLRLEYHTDANGWVNTVVREWKRRDWGDGGTDLHWWCTDNSDAFVGKEPVYKYLKEEIIESVGAKVYDLLVEALERPTAVTLPHPVLTVKKSK